MSRSRAVDVINTARTSLCARDVLVVLKIFLPFLQKKNERIFFFFFDFLTRPNRTTDETDRSLHSFTQTGGGFLFETSSSTRVNTFRERTFYSRAKEARLIHARE